VNTANIDAFFALAELDFILGDIGEPLRHIEIEPIPETEPVHEPSPEPAPAEPVSVPEEEPVPA
jgi:hypothetical protein